MRAVVIDPKQLPMYRQRLAVYDFNQSNFSARGDYRAFDDSLILRGAGVGEATRVYFRACAYMGERPLRFWGIRHFLYHGEIDIRKLEVVEG